MELVASARNPIPQGAAPGRMVTADGRAVRYCLFPQTRESWRGTVCLFGGWGEFIEKYFETVEDLRERGFAVATMDWRCQGGSDRLLADPGRGHVEDFAHYERDLSQFMSEIVLANCPAPFLGMAHSMGGHILLRAALDNPNWFERLVLSAPMIDIHRELTRSPVLRFVIEVLALIGFSEAFVPGGKSRPSGLDPFEGNDLTSDKTRYERTRETIEAAPRLGLGAPTIGWLRAAQRSIMRVNAPNRAEGLQVPTLILAAGADRIVSTPMTEAFAKRARAVHYGVIAGSRHEILQERNEIRSQFWAAFDAHGGA
jgi:lysophospholipase